jgi:hypothetical protein
MKRTFILSLATALTAALIFTSCQPSRVWANKKKDRDNDRDREREEYYEPEYRPAPPPPPSTTRYRQPSYLILSPSPGFVMKPGPNGRFYHRSPGGLLYWKGYDNRFYLDRNYLDNVSYSRWEYDEWKRYSRQSR